MKKVYQTRYGKKEGNCFQAALASLFELELDKVPNFCNIYSTETQEWYEEFLKWLHKRGYSSVPLYYSDTKSAPLRYKDCILLVTGKNQDGIYHCAIYKNGKPIHNPNKNCKGIKPETMDIIFPIDISSELKYYATKHCTLCGNSGYIDSTGTKTPAGKVGEIMNITTY